MVLSLGSFAFTLNLHAEDFVGFFFGIGMKWCFIVLVLIRVIRVCHVVSRGSNLISFSSTGRPLTRPICSRDKVLPGETWSRTCWEIWHCLIPACCISQSLAHHEDSCSDLCALWTCHCYDGRLWPWIQIKWIPLKPCDCCACDELCREWLGFHMSTLRKVVKCSVLQGPNTHSGFLFLLNEVGACLRKFPDCSQPAV